MRKLCEICIENLNIDNFYLHRKENIWFNKCKKCVNEKVKRLLCERYI